MSPERFIKLITQAGYEARSYSGRGMYGRTCVAVDVSLRGVCLLGYKLARTCFYFELDELEVVLADTREDNLGDDLIIYWPHLEWPKP